MNLGRKGRLWGPVGLRSALTPHKLAFTFKKEDPSPLVCVCVCVCVHACVRSVNFDSVTPRTVARQAPLSMGFPSQDDWSRLPFPSPGDLPSPGVEPTPLVSPALQAGSLSLRHLGSLF